MSTSGTGFTARRGLRIAFALGISGLFLYLAVRGVEWGRVGKILLGAEYVYVIPAMVLVLLGFGVRAVRWRVICEPIGRLRLQDLFRAAIIGFAANNVLPLRVGEFVRAYAVSRGRPISFSSALATILIDRLLDGMTILLFLPVVLIYLPLPDWVGEVALLALVLYMGVTVALLLGRHRTALVWRLGSRLLRWVPSGLRRRVDQGAAGFAEGLGILSRPRSLVAVTLFSVTMWGLAAIYYQVIGWALGLSLSFPQALALLVILALGVMLPSSPGFVGTFQYFNVLALSLFGTDRELAISYSFLSHAGWYVPVTLLGLYYWTQEEISLKRVYGTVEEGVGSSSDGESS